MHDHQFKALAACKKYKITSTMYVFPLNSQTIEIKFIFLSEICFRLNIKIMQKEHMLFQYTVNVKIFVRVLFSRICEVS